MWYEKGYRLIEDQIHLVLSRQGHLKVRLVDRRFSSQVEKLVEDLMKLGLVHQNLPDTISAALELAYNRLPTWHLPEEGNLQTLMERKLSRRKEMRFVEDVLLAYFTLLHVSEKASLSELLLARWIVTMGTAYPPITLPEGFSSPTIASGTASRMTTE